jgi:hypothetical protein
MAQETDLESGDKPCWDSLGGHDTGKLVEKQTTLTRIELHEVAVPRDKPEIHRRERQVRPARRARARGAAKVPNRPGRTIIRGRT